MFRFLNFLIETRSLRLEKPSPKFERVRFASLYSPLHKTWLRFASLIHFLTINCSLRFVTRIFATARVCFASQQEKQLFRSFRSLSFAINFRLDGNFINKQFASQFMIMVIRNQTNFKARYCFRYNRLACFIHFIVLYCSCN